MSDEQNRIQFREGYSSLSIPRAHIASTWEDWNDHEIDLTMKEIRIIIHNSKFLTIFVTGRSTITR